MSWSGCTSAKLYIAVLCVLATMIHLLIAWATQLDYSSHVEYIAVKRKEVEDIAMTRKEVEDITVTRKKTLNCQPTKYTIQYDNISTVSIETGLRTDSDQPLLKVLHIGFLKVHKAGSSTIQNLLFRFGLKHNLSFALPKQSNYLLHYRNVLSTKSNQSFDIFAVHANNFYPELFGRLVPRDSVKLAIVREPFDRMVSAAFYYRDVFGVRYLKRIPKLNFIHQLVTQPDLYDEGTFSYTRNSMGRDFAFSTDLKSTDVKQINSYMDYLRKDINLVLVLERFDESLVLMKRYLRWSLSDVLYIEINSHKHAPIVLNQSETDTFQKTCFLDVAIYNSFSNLFDEKVKQEQNDFIGEVAHFKTIIANVSTFCARNTTHSSPTLFINHSRWNDKFKVTKEDCRLMTTDEQSFINVLRERQIKMFT